MIRYIKQSGKPDPKADLTFADFDYVADNDVPPQGLGWQLCAGLAIWAAIFGLLILLVLILN